MDYGSINLPRVILEKQKKRWCTSNLMVCKEIPQKRYQIQLATETKKSCGPFYYCFSWTRTKNENWYGFLLNKNTRLFIWGPTWKKTAESRILIGQTSVMLRWLLPSPPPLKFNHGVVRALASFISWIQLNHAPRLAFCFLYQILLLFLQGRKRYLWSHSSSLREVRSSSLINFAFCHFLFFFFSLLIWLCCVSELLL